MRHSGVDKAGQTLRVTECASGESFCPNLHIRGGEIEAQMPRSAHGVPEGKEGRVLRSGPCLSPWVWLVLL